MKTLLIALAFVASLGAQIVTTVSDTLYDARMKPVTGLITLTWPAFTRADGIYIAPGRAMVPVTKGVFALSISPTDTATPAFTYHAFYAIPNYSRNPEDWTVCTSVSPQTIASLLNGGTCNGGGGGGGALSWATLTSSQWAGLTSTTWASMTI